VLIEQLAGTFAARFLKLAFGLRATKSRAIGGRFRFRLTAPGALPEPFQIDQIPHNGPRHAGWLWVGEGALVCGGSITLQIIGSTLESSILIYQIPYYAVRRKMSCFDFRNNFCSTMG
jgi:hypothetical protein